EPDQPCERAQLVEELAQSRQLPLQFHVRDQARDEDEIERAFAGHLIGDVHVAAQGITCLRLHRHILTHTPRHRPDTARTADHTVATYARAFFSRETVLVLAGSDLFNAKLPYVREGEAGSRG